MRTDNISNIGRKLPADTDSITDLCHEDLGRFIEHANEMHRIVRKQGYDIQTQFDKTLVYICCGAIALSYGLFEKLPSGSCTILLFIAIASWGLCCFLALITMALQRMLFNRVSCGFWGLSFCLGQFACIIQELDDLEQRIEMASAKRKQKQYAELSSKVGISRQELLGSIKMAKAAIRDLYEGSKNYPVGNSIKIFVFVIGILCFFALLCIPHISN